MYSQTRSQCSSLLAKVSSHHYLRSSVDQQVGIRYSNFNYHEIHTFTENAQILWIHRHEKHGADFVTTRDNWRAASSKVKQTDGTEAGVVALGFAN